MNLAEKLVGYVFMKHSETEGFIDEYIKYKGFPEKIIGQWQIIQDEEFEGDAERTITFSSTGQCGAEITLKLRKV